MATNFIDTSDFIGRALLVQGISSVHSQYQTVDKLTIHFQRKSNKGGDVTKVLYPLDSNRDAAVVVFDDAKDRESTLLHRHVFGEVRLQVERLPPVFRSVEVEIDPVYARLLPDMVRNLMRDQGHLRSHRFGTQYTHKLSFSHPSELRDTEEKVYRYIAMQSETARFSSAATGYSDPERAQLIEEKRINYEDEAATGKKRNSYQLGDVDPEDFIDQPTTGRDDSAAHASGDKKKEGNETITTDVQRGPQDQTCGYDNDGFSTQTDHSVVLDMFSYNFVMEFEKSSVEKILKNHDVRIIENSIDLSVRATFAASKSKTPEEEIMKAVEEFTLLYQKIHGKLYRKSVECPPSISKDVLEKAALKTSTVFKSNALITKVDHNPIYYVILSSKDAEEVAQHFRKGAGIPSKKKLRTSTPAPSPENKETVSEETIGRSVATTQSKQSDGLYGQNKTESLGGRPAPHSLQSPGDNFVTNEGMTIFIHKGDITRLHEVHAIVNPTDGNLRNSGGASNAIGTAAGAQLGKWCDQYRQAHGYNSLWNSKCCVSPGFSLSCHIIIHVGPMTVTHNRQDLMKVLYQTFLNCLQVAHENKVVSLAMPLLGSGGTCAPKQVCADALTWALIDFSREPSRILSEVYLVNIDSAANVALKHSLESAFMETRMVVSGDQHSSRKNSTASVKNGEMFPDSRSTYNSKEQPKHHTGQMPIQQNLPMTQPTADLGCKSTTDEGHSDMKMTKKDPLGSTDAESNTCAICLTDEIVNDKVLKCKHHFCKACIDKALEQSHKCPVCRAVCVQPKGNQPKNGTMTVTTLKYSHLPGYDNAGTINICYYVPSGTQSKCHPHPGQPFTGITRTAYLPDNQEGRKVLTLLRKAFDAGLVFTVGQSVTSGMDNTVTWNDIHHKTSQTGGPYGYPDPGYLKRVTEDLAALGIV